MSVSGKKWTERKPNNRIIEKATITENGNLTKKYEYLKDYIS